MAEVICICGKYESGECDRKCAGAITQQQECERKGHLTPENMARKTRLIPTHRPSAFGFCLRCGWKSPERAAYEKHHEQVIASARGEHT